MKLIILLICSMSFYLLWESWLVNKERKKLLHVIYVNGTRGKSTVTRLIASGLSATYKVYSKTTGSVPMIIDTNGNEKIIKRRGRATIKEQQQTLLLAVKDQADILVIECMALEKEYQAMSQDKMLQSDIGVMTNIRRDHTEIMGETIEDIAFVLSHSLPRKGLMFTGDPQAFELMKPYNETKENQSILTTTTEKERKAYGEIDFPENIALALEVCKYLGVSSLEALEKMKNYPRDPYALSIHYLPLGGLFIGALSINDAESIINVFESIQENLSLGDKKKILLIHTRSDRSTRTRDMATAIKKINPDELWILGNGASILKRQLQKINMPLSPLVLNWENRETILLINEQSFIFATGNLGQGGIELMEFINENQVELR